MRKIWVILFLGVTLLPHSAGAKVCFLPSVFGGDEYCLSDEDAKKAAVESEKKQFSV